MTEYEPNGKVKVERHEVDYDYTYPGEDGTWYAFCTCGKAAHNIFPGPAERSIEQHATDMNRKLDA